MIKNFGVLIKTENQDVTPFKYSRVDKAIKIIDIESGMELLFPVK